MRLRHHRHGAVRVAQRELVLSQDPVVAGIGIGGPLCEAGLTAGAIVAAARPGAGPERLGGVVRSEHCDPARPTVCVRGADDVREVGLAGHIVHRVVEQYGVELPAEPDRAHVPLQVFAPRVELPRYGEHVSRQVGERDRPVAPEVHGDMTAAAAKVKERAHGYRGGSEFALDRRGVAGILVRR